MHLFYTPDITAKQYQLSESESKHCIRVLRLRINDTIHLIDGVGGFYSARIVDDNPRACIVEVTDKQENFGSHDYYLHIAIAPTKNIDRFEWFLEKATEIGIDEITPILSEYSERKVIKPERLNKIITSAVKQSLTAFHPKLNPLIKLSDFLKKSIDANKFIAHCYETEKEELKNMQVKNSRQVILIGPEGDFSLKELDLAQNAGFIPVALGDRRLRTETAGIVACHTVSLMN